MKYVKHMFVGVGLFVLGVSMAVPILNTRIASAEPYQSVTPTRTWKWVDAQTLEDSTGKSFLYSSTYTTDYVSNNFTGAVFVATNKNDLKCSNNPDGNKQQGYYSNRFFNDTKGASVIIIELRDQKGSPASEWSPMGNNTGNYANSSKATLIEYTAPGNAASYCGTKAPLPITLGAVNNTSTVLDWFDSETIVGLGYKGGQIFKHSTDKNFSNRYILLTSDGCKDYIEIQSNTKGVYHNGKATSGAGSSCEFPEAGPVILGMPENKTGRKGSATSAPTGACATGKLDDEGKCVDESDKPLDCGGGKLNWIVCPVITAMQEAAVKLDRFIMNALTVDVKPIFDDSATSNGYYTAWASFRTLAVALLIIAGLIMVVSQAIGLEILDAYTIRKALPRLVLAIIGISLSWPLARFLIELFNTVGTDIRSLMYHPFSNFQNDTVNFETGISTSFGIGTTAAVVGAGVIYGPAIFSFVLTALLAILVGYLIIVLRQIALVTLVILAPVAIACSILPSTQKIWKMFRENFTGLLIMFPIISALIATGHIFAAVSLRQVPGEPAGTGQLRQAIGLLAYFLPYFALPLAARFATGVIGNLAGMVNDRSRGAFDRLKGMRQKAAEENVAGLKKGFERTRVGSALTSGKQRRVARREAWGSGAAGIGKLGSSRYRAALESTEMSTRAAEAAEAIKNNPSAAANDDANKFARIATSRADFINLYKQFRMDQGASAEAATAEAMSQATATEQAFGAVMGSNRMKHIAATAALASNSSTDTVTERAQWMRDAVSSGVMTATQAANAVKQSGSLASSAGFGDLLTAATAKPISTSERNAVDDALLDAASRGFNPANSQRIRKGQAQELAGHLAKQIERAAAGTGGTSSAEFAKAVADAAGLHDMSNGMTPDVREQFVALLSKKVNGVSVREYEAELEATKNPAYLDRRKTWASNPAGFGGNTPTPTGGPGDGKS